ncbi:MAG: outer membrane beta-barrel protein [Saprospiraceae bacterium]
MKKGVSILIFLFVLGTQMTAQNEGDERANEIPKGTFKAGLVLGLNACQIDGDAFAGYNKLGLQAGIEVAYRVDNLWMYSVGIFYNQKGSRTNPQINRLFGVTHYQLDYVEVPLMLNYVDGGIRISAGLSYGRLIDIDIALDAVDETALRAPYYLDNDFSVVLGFGYFIDEHWGFDFRWTRSILNIVDLDVGNIINQPQVNKYLSFRSTYLF